MTISMNRQPVLNQPLFHTDHVKDHPTEHLLMNSLGDAPPSHVNEFNVGLPQYFIISRISW